MSARSEPDVRPLEMHRDQRGWVVELLRGGHLPERTFGQLYVTAAHPGFVKGNHYHTRKHEWFVAVHGKGELVLRDRTNGEQTTHPLDAENPATIHVPPGQTHAIVNSGDEALVVVGYISEEYDPADADTFPEVVDPAPVRHT